MTLRLHYNENTAGCSSAVIDALGALTPADVATYMEDAKTRQDIARWFGVAGDWTLPVNGLDEGILLAAQLAAFESRSRFNAIVVEPAFEVYASVVASMGGDVRALEPVEDFAFDPARVLARANAETRLVFLCDPNNPTGLGLARADIEAIADSLPGTLIFVDEAYADFSGRSIIGASLADRPNIVAGRTFAKAHGLAALRIGAIVAAPSTIARLQRLVLPYRINIAAAVALRAALGDRAHFAKTVADAAGSRALLAAACERLGLETWPSDANFCLVRIGARAREFSDWMDGRGVRVRDRSQRPGCEGCVRITAGPPAHTRQAIDLMEEWHANESR
jgi:histidinol-phosphate aminotransferase